MMFHIKNYCFQDLHLAQELYTNRMEQGKCLLTKEKLQKLQTFYSTN